MKQSDAMLRVLKARMNIARRNVFFASICFNAKIVESTMFPTMWTNGIDIFFNPEFVKQEDQFIEGVFLHEVLHCALLHVGRKEWREPLKFNMACDYSINPLVLKSYRLPAKRLDDPKYHNMSPERIYELLPDNPQGGKGGKGDKGNKSFDPDLIDPSPEELEAAERSWRRVVHNAIERAEKAGTLPGDIRRLCEDLFPLDKINWRDLIRDMVRNAKSRSSSSWSRPNRRFLGNGMILPGFENDQVYRIVLCLDTSGSINDEVLKQMKAEGMSLLEQEIVNEVVMISTDTRVCSEAMVTSSEEVEKFDCGRCGGGTQFDAAMARVAEVKNAVGCIFLTDMQTSSFGKDPGIPTVWVDWTNGGAVAPYGQTVRYQ
jgi:predicted metal-dependent peptidase